MGCCSRHLSRRAWRCVGVDEASRDAKLGSKADEPIKLTDAEQMIDDLDRIMTAYGTISVKTPDVWGQDRLAKFRSEYELQMAEWLKHGFKTDINAAVRRSEIESTQVQVGTTVSVPSIARTQPLQDENSSLTGLSKTLASMSSAVPATNLPAEQDAAGSRADRGAR